VKTYTVIGYYEDTGQVFTSTQRATNPFCAMRDAANEPESIETLVLVAAIEGEHDVFAPCEGSECVASAMDLLTL
jgi:hypothetical protein